MRMISRGETTFIVAPKEQTLCESLRQKDSCLTQLWRAFIIYNEPPKGKARIGKLSGVKDRDQSHFRGGFSVLFLHLKAITHSAIPVLQRAENPLP